MRPQEPRDQILSVYLRDSLDLKALYGNALREGSGDVVLRHPHAIDHPEDVRFAICWLPDERAFEPYPNLVLAMSTGAGLRVGGGAGAWHHGPFRGAGHAELGFSVRVACCNGPEAPV